jgi:hypothetical protein
LSRRRRRIVLRSCTYGRRRRLSCGRGSRIRRWRNRSLLPIARVYSSVRSRRGKRLILGRHGRRSTVPLVPSAANILHGSALYLGVGASRGGTARERGDGGILAFAAATAAAAFDEGDGDPEEGGDGEGLPPDVPVAEGTALFALSLVKDD